MKITLGQRIKNKERIRPLRALRPTKIDIWSMDKEYYAEYLNKKVRKQKNQEQGTDLLPFALNKNKHSDKRGKNVALNISIKNSEK